MYKVLHTKKLATTLIVCFTSLDAMGAEQYLSCGKIAGKGTTISHRPKRKIPGLDARFGDTREEKGDPGHDIHIFKIMH